jgi:L-amino acid N-acyltransferase YncA
MPVVIRLARESDAAQMLEIYGPVVRDTTISFELVPPTEDELRRRIRSTLEKTPWLVCEAGGRVAGYVYAGLFRTRQAYQWTVETTVYVHPDCPRRGVGRALYTSLLECLRIQGYYSATAGITLPNTASVALHESLGYRLVGVFQKAGYKHGGWHDVGWWQLELLGHSPSPAPPVPINDLVGMPAWNDALRVGMDLLKF